MCARMSFALVFLSPHERRIIGGYIRIGRGSRPPGDGLSLQNSRGSPWLPGARRRTAHLSNLPGDIPEETTPHQRRRVHILHGRPTSPSTSLHCALHRVRERARARVVTIRVNYTPNSRHMDGTMIQKGSCRILRGEPSAFNVKLFRRCNLVKDREMSPL